MLVYFQIMKGWFDMSIIFNHKKLEQRIIAIFGETESFGKLLGLDNQQINSRLKGETEFSQSEIEKSVELLKIEPAEIYTYFFDTEGMK